MLKAIHDYSSDYKPNAQYQQSPGWLLQAHKAAYPHVHEWEQTQISGRGLMQPKQHCTYFVAHEVRGPNVYAPRAASFIDSFNTSTPKAAPFMNPFSTDRPVPVPF